MKNRRSPFSQLKTALIFSGSRWKTAESVLVRTYEGSAILSCTTSSGYRVGLLFGAAQPSAVKPFPPAPGMWYLVYFYGNGMCLETCSYEFAQFRQLGCTVLIPEYPGYGISSGWASESGCYEAADAAYPDRCRWLVDFSAAVAIDHAARNQVAGLILLSAFTNIPEQAHAMLPWVPKSVVRLFIKERFDNVSKICRVTCPLFIGHGTQDELALCHGRAPCTSSGPRRPVTFLPIEEGGHNGIFEVSRGRVWTAIKGNYSGGMPKVANRTRDLLQYKHEQ